MGGKIAIKEIAEFFDFTLILEEFELGIWGSENGGDIMSPQKIPYWEIQWNPNGD